MRYIPAATSYESVIVSLIMSLYLFLYIYLEIHLCPELFNRPRSSSARL